ncbi:MAG: hypothetical protein KatS3mg102_0055 [Planctomycetota bacterium]|nr:MAG: hypothetical protein KatS3mg102_0055 [Planctomycetota bacterium]
MGARASAARRGCKRRCERRWRPSHGWRSITPRCATAATLEPAAPGMASLVALVAARAGRTRLLDNALLGQGEH